MAFRNLPDNRGKIYLPETDQLSRKKPCSDCFACQWCSDERCLLCRGGAGAGKKSKRRQRVV